MIKVKTYLEKSKIHGFGLFAKEKIKAGSLVYKPSPGLDIKIKIKDFKKLDKYSKEQIKHYGFLTKDKKFYLLAFDNIRFCNHSISKNNIGISNKNNYGIYAKRNINKGEELLQDFREFEDLRRCLQTKKSTLEP